MPILDLPRRYALLGKLMAEMVRAGSWTGETHIQKSVFFLQMLFEVPTGFHFVLYKHGPYSFELRQTLTTMRANLLLTTETHDPYGPSFRASDLSNRLTRAFQRTVRQYSRGIEFVAERLSTSTVHELERLSTALFVTLDDPQGGLEARADQLSKLKPHIPIESALKSMNKMDSIREEVEQIRAAQG